MNKNILRINVSTTIGMNYRQEAGYTGMMLRGVQVAFTLC